MPASAVAASGISRGGEAMASGVLGASSVPVIQDASPSEQAAKRRRLKSESLADGVDEIAMEAPPTQTRLGGKTPNGEAGVGGTDESASCGAKDNRDEVEPPRASGGGACSSVGVVAPASTRPARLLPLYDSLTAQSAPTAAGELNVQWLRLLCNI